MNCEWLPNLVICEDWSMFPQYIKLLYDIFSNDFIKSKPVFQNKAVNIKKYPLVNEFEQSFFHIISKDYHIGDEERAPDPRRCERIKWIRKLIEHYNCKKETCKTCSGIKVWEEPYGNKTRIHIMFEEERFMVVLENRENYILLITAYYIEYNHTLKKILNRYNKFKK